MHSPCPRFAALWIWVLFAGCLFGQVFEGKILEDHSGNALPSVRIRVHRSGTNGLAADLETESNGRFRAPELPPGEYRIGISKPNCAAAELRLRLPSAPVLVRLVRFGAIAGRVTDAQGRPAQGATVFPMVQSAGGHFRKVSVSGAAQTDDRGQFRLYNLRPGQYAVGVSWARLKPGSPSGAYFYPNNTHPELFSVSGGEEYDGVDVVLPHGGHSISGRVQLPAQGMRCSISLVSIDQPALAVAMTQANPDGSFRLDGIPLGSYELMASAPAVGFSSRSVVLGPEPLFGSARVELAGQSVDALTISLHKGRTVRFQLRATASEMGRTCPSSATVTLSPLENWGAMLYRTVQITSAREQTLEGLAPGRYHITVTKLGGKCFGATNSIIDLRAAADPVSVPIIVTEAGSIRGRLSAGAAKPQDFIVVLLPSSSIEGEDTVRIGLPNTQSDFNFSALRPGRYRIATRPAAETSTTRWVPDLDRMTQIEVLSGKSTQVELTAPLVRVR